MPVPDRDTLGSLPTEARNPASEHLDELSTLEMLAVINAEDAKVADRLLSLLADVECRGKQVHDANVVATMLVHGVRAVVTMNTGDFARFEGHVSLIRL